jgi:hypothetical protein
MLEGTFGYPYIYRPTDIMSERLSRIQNTYNKNTSFAVESVMHGMPGTDKLACSGLMRNSHFQMHDDLFGDNYNALSVFLDRKDPDGEPSLGDYLFDSEETLKNIKQYLKQ